MGTNLSFVCVIFSVLHGNPPSYDNMTNGMDVAADNLTVIQNFPQSTSKLPSNILTITHLPALRDLMSTKKITGCASSSLCP